LGYKTPMAPSEAEGSLFKRTKPNPSASLGAIGSLYVCTHPQTNINVKLI
jgi:hypothetical protein